MNYLEELQKINQDYKKAKLVIQSCVWANQLEAAAKYSTAFVSYHCSRLGIVKKYTNKLRWFFCEHEKREKNKIVEYIDLCVADLQGILEDKESELREYYDNATIGYGDPNMLQMNRIISEVKKWEEKKVKEDIEDVYRTFESEKLQVD